MLKACRNQPPRELQLRHGTESKRGLEVFSLDGINLKVKDGANNETG
jgi:hypothetical protein